MSIPHHQGNLPGALSELHAPPVPLAARSRPRRPWPHHSHGKSLAASFPACFRAPHTAKLSKTKEGRGLHTLPNLGVPSRSGFVKLKCGGASGFNRVDAGSPGHRKPCPPWTWVGPASLPFTHSHLLPGFPSAYLLFVSFCLSVSLGPCCPLLGEGIPCVNLLHDRHRKAITQQGFSP